VFVVSTYQFVTHDSLRNIRVHYIATSKLKLLQLHYNTDTATQNLNLKEISMVEFMKFRYPTVDIGYQLKLAYDLKVFESKWELSGHF